MTSFLNGSWLAKHLDGKSCALPHRRTDSVDSMSITKAMLVTSISVVRKLGSMSLGIWQLDFQKMTEL